MIKFDSEEYLRNQIIDIQDEIESLYATYNDEPQMRDDILFDLDHLRSKLARLQKEYEDNFMSL